MLDKSEFRGACPECGWWVPKSYFVDNCTQCGHSLVLKPLAQLGELRNHQTDKHRPSAGHLGSLHSDATANQANGDGEPLITGLLWMLAMICPIGGFLLAISKETPQGLGKFFIALGLINFALFACVATAFGQLQRMNETIKRIDRKNSQDSRNT